MRSRLLAALLLGVALLTTSAAPAVSADPSPGPETPEPVSGEAMVALVPVLRFWTPRRDISSDEVRAAIEGGSEDFRRVLVMVEEPAGLWESLGVEPADTTRSASYEAIRAKLGSSRSVLGLLPAGEVRPDVRALAVDGWSLFGEDRVDGLEDWPLTVPAGAIGLEADFEPAETWTIAAAGDVMLDREVYRKSVLQGRGSDYAWNGGWAKITSRTCCTKDGGPAITSERTGARGAVRELLTSADIAIVNHEGPAPNDASYHPSGLVFTFEPSLLEGVVNAGVDIVSLANNHIRNAGSRGVKETIRNLRAEGIRVVGAGSDPERARKPACFDQGALRVCFLAYNAIDTVAHSVTGERAGAAELVVAHVKADIGRLRREGADVIVVVPHWGPEYVTRLFPRQRTQARAMVRAGADVVLGAHSHVVGPIEFIDGAPVLYSLGDFIFDLPRFEATEEGVIAELTFHGPDLVQVELHPTVIVERSQVNLLDRAGDGEVVIERMRKASRRLE